MSDPIDMAMREPLSEQPQFKVVWSGRTFWFLKRDAAEAFANGIRRVTRRAPKVEPAEPGPEPATLEVDS